MTEARLEKRLRFQLDCSRIVWKRARRGQFAKVVAESGQNIIYLPPGHDDDFTLRTLLHELMHVAIPGELAAFGIFEEDILERVLEPRMMDHLLRHPAKQAWWLKRLKSAREA